MCSGMPAETGDSSTAMSESRSRISRRVPSISAMPVSEKVRAKSSATFAAGAFGTVARFMMPSTIVATSYMYNDFAKFGFTLPNTLST